MREPTLPLQLDVCRRNIGFTSPWLVRIRLYLSGLMMRRRSFVYRERDIVIRGWDDKNLEYLVTRVRRPFFSRAVPDAGGKAE